MRCSCARLRARAGAPHPARATRPTRRAALRVAPGGPGHLAASCVVCWVLSADGDSCFPLVSGAAGAAADPSPSLKAPASAAGNAHPSGAPEPVPGWAACDSAAADAPNHPCTGAEAAPAAPRRERRAPPPRRCWRRGWRSSAAAGTRRTRRAWRTCARWRSSWAWPARSTSPSTRPSARRAARAPCIDGALRRGAPPAPGARRARPTRGPAGAPDMRVPGPAPPQRRPRALGGERAPLAPALF